MRVDDPPPKFGEMLTNTNDALHPPLMGMYLGPSGHAFWPHLALVVRDETGALGDWTGTVKKVNWIKRLGDE